MSNTSYQGLLLPNNSYHLLNSNDSYFFSKNILLGNQVNPNICSSLMALPQDINIGALHIILVIIKNILFDLMPQ